MDRLLTSMVIDKSGRLAALIDALNRSRRNGGIFALSEVSNPALASKAVVFKVARTDDPELVVAYAKKTRPAFVFIGPEEPLGAGVVDALREVGIPAIGPVWKLAQIETSKSFTRELLRDYGIQGNPEYRKFDSKLGLEEYLREQKSFVVKPDGLTGGKGVKVFGEHLHSIEEALRYCDEVFRDQANGVVIEELLEGEEFSYQSFCDGHHMIHTIPVQDHKRAMNGDSGPNTGGMGSYSCEDHLLPFLKREHIEQAKRTNEAVARALYDKTGEEYKGILYGSFMLTKGGLRVIEYNARFGDPEIMNVLPLLDADFIDVCEAIIEGSLNKLEISFKPLASVCKYIVPEAYPANAGTNAEIRIGKVPQSSDRLRVYFAAVNGRGGKWFLTGSRAVAVVGIGRNLAEAEVIAEDAACKFEGPVRHRSDIGTAELVARRVAHINRLCGESKTLPKEAHITL